MNRVINTIFGRAIINIDGYYQITSSKEGNYGEKLHRLIWEKAWIIIGEQFQVLILKNWKKKLKQKD